MPKAIKATGLSLVVGAAFVLLATFSFAENETSSTDISSPQTGTGSNRLLPKIGAFNQEDLDEKWSEIREKQASIQARLKLLKEKRASIASDLKHRLTEMKINNIKAWTQRILKRDRALLLRLSNILSRIESRIAKMEARGHDLADAKAKVEVAKGKIQDAQTAINQAEEAFGAITTSDSPKEAFQIAKEAQGNVKEAFKKIHRALRDIVVLINASDSNKEASSAGTRE